MSAFRSANSAFPCHQHISGFCKGAAQTVFAAILCVGWLSGTPVQLQAQEADPQEEKIYVEARDELKAGFEDLQTSFNNLNNALSSFQRNVKAWQGATTTRTQDAGRQGINDLGRGMVKGLRDKAIESLLGDDYGPKLVNMLHNLEAQTGMDFGIPSRQSMQDMIATAVGRERLYGHMYRLSALERKMREKGVFSRLKSVKAKLKSAEGHINSLSNMVDFVAVFDPNNVDKDSSVSRLRALGGALRYMKQFTTKIPALGKMIDYYAEATDAFAKALIGLDKKIQAHRVGSLCGKRETSPQSRALSTYLVNDEGELDCLSFLPFYPAEALLAPVKAWRHASTQDVFLFAPDGRHAFLSRDQFAKLSGPYQALQASRFKANQNLADKTTLLRMALVASEKAVASGDRQYVPGYERCLASVPSFFDKDFIKILRWASVTDRVGMFEAKNSGARFLTGRTSRDELLGLCALDSQMRAKMEAAVQRYAPLTLHEMQVFPKDYGQAPVFSGFELNDANAVFRRNWVRQGNGYFSLPVLISRDALLAYVIHAKGFKPLRFEGRVRGREPKRTILHMERLPEETVPPEEANEKQTRDNEKQSDTRQQVEAGKPTSRPPSDIRDTRSGTPYQSTPSSSSGSAPTAQEPSIGSPDQEFGVPNTAENDVSNGQPPTGQPSNVADREEQGEQKSPSLKDAIDSIADSIVPAIPAVGDVIDTTASAGGQISEDFTQQETDYSGDALYLGEKRMMSVEEPDFQDDGEQIEYDETNHAAGIIISRADDTEDLVPSFPVRYHWRSTPPIEFDPAITPIATTTAKFTHLGKVEVWADVTRKGQTIPIKAGAYQVRPPDFGIYISEQKSDDGGIVVEAELLSTPSFKSDEYRLQWSGLPDNADINEKAASASFTSKPGETLTIGAQVHLAGSQKSMASLSKHHVVGGADITLEVKRRGPPPMVWDPTRKGLVEAKPDQYMTGEALDLSVEFVGMKQPDDIRWRWQADGESSISNDIASMPTLTRSTAGAADVSVRILDKNGKEIATAKRSLQFVDENRPAKPEKDQQDKQDKGDEKKKANSNKKKIPTQSSPPASRAKKDAQDQRKPISKKPQQPAGADKKKPKQATPPPAPKQVTQKPVAPMSKPPVSKPPVAPVDPCAVGQSQHQAAAQMWQTGLQALTAKNQERAFAHFEASLTLCPDAKRQAMVDQLRQQLDNQAKQQVPAPTSPIDPCAKGQAQFEKAKQAWMNGLSALKAGQSRDGLASLGQSLALCPDDKRAAQLTQLRERFASLQQQAAKPAAPPTTAPATNRKPSGGLLSGAHPTQTPYSQAVRPSDALRNNPNAGMGPPPINSQNSNVQSKAPSSGLPGGGLGLPSYNPSAAKPAPATRPFDVAPTGEDPRGADDQTWQQAKRSQTDQGLSDNTDAAIYRGNIAGNSNNELILHLDGNSSSGQIRGEFKAVIMGNGVTGQFSGAVRNGRFDIVFRVAPVHRTATSSSADLRLTGRVSGNEMSGQVSMANGGSRSESWSARLTKPAKRPQPQSSKPRSQPSSSKPKITSCEDYMTKLNPPDVGAWADCVADRIPSAMPHFN